MNTAKNFFLCAAAIGILIFSGDKMYRLWKMHSDEQLAQEKIVENQKWIDEQVWQAKLAEKQKQLDEQVLQKKLTEKRERMDEQLRQERLAEKRLAEKKLADKRRWMDKFYENEFTRECKVYMNIKRSKPHFLFADVQFDNTIRAIENKMVQDGYSYAESGLIKQRGYKAAH